jgi:predicted transcriptional regulator
LKRKRSKLEIVEGVLDYVAREGGEAHATKIATHNGLAYDRLVDLLEELRAKRIVEIDVAEGRRIVRITSKGLRLLKTLRDLRRAIRDFGLEL